MKKKERIENLRQRLPVAADKLAVINDMLLDPGNKTINRLLSLIDKFGGPDKINEKAKKVGELKRVMDKLKNMKSPYVDDLNWLIRARDEKKFVSMDEYRDNINQDGINKVKFNDKNAVTLEISALQYFPWLIEEAREAVRARELMPGRFIRVRNMAEQVRDNGDILATAAAMEIIGASYVETLDTKGIAPLNPDDPNSPPANCHLGGPDTITGYFGGIGQPNGFALKWAEEFLHYYTEYGVKHVLNINSGTVMLGYLMYKLGIDIEFKISVFMGNDNEFSVLWTLLTAALFSRTDFTTPLQGFNLSNSANNETIRLGAQIRELLGLTDKVRFEHHITETYRSIVLQPYLRRGELVLLAEDIPNIAAKHEGGNPAIEAAQKRPSDIMDYFMPKKAIEEAGLMETMQKHYLLKHSALNDTAWALTRAGIGVKAARKLH